MKMLMPFERFNKRGKKRDEAFSTNPVGGVPNQDQRVLDFWPRLGVGVGAEVCLAPLSHD
jgi:hypothetical protein